MGAKLTVEQKNEIINIYEQGFTLRQMARDLPYARCTISKVLKENSIIIRDNVINSRKYYHNEDFFENIDTEQKAYWLGFFYADGFIESQRGTLSQNFGITLNSKDRLHLEKFKKNINATNPIHEYTGSGYSPDSKFSKILLNSNKTVRDLIKKGCLENKTYILTFPNENIVPKNLLHHFVRGYFDGDGSIYHTQTAKTDAWGISFTGTYEMILGINHFFEKENHAICKRNNAFYCSFGGTYNVANIISKMYEYDTTVYLERKFQKSLEFIKYCESKGI